MRANRDNILSGMWICAFLGNSSALNQMNQVFDREFPIGEGVHYSDYDNFRQSCMMCTTYPSMKNDLLRDAYDRLEEVRRFERSRVRAAA
jgi:hypothetical protein